VGRVSPPLDTCENFARALGVPLARLVRGGGRRSPRNPTQHS
jgi:hypothetical protein